MRDAERLVEAHRYDEAFWPIGMRAPRWRGAPAPLALRLLRGEAWALIRTRRSRCGHVALEEAAAVAVAAGFTDVDRAEVVFLVGVVRYSQSSIPEAIVLFDQALVLAEGPALPGSTPFGHLPLAIAVPSAEPRLGRRRGRHRARARARGSVRGHAPSRRRALPGLARRSTPGTLGARAHVRRASAGALRGARRPGNGRSAAEQPRRARSPPWQRVRAIALLERAFEIFVDLDLPVDAGYVCSSLAEIRLACGEPRWRETQARKALDLLGDRLDHLQEVGTAQLALGRALAAQGRLDDAETWIARRRRLPAGALDRSSQLRLDRAGRLESQRGNDRDAAGLYRRAARALQDADV